MGVFEVRWRRPFLTSLSSLSFLPLLLFHFFPSFSFISSLASLSFLFFHLFSSLLFSSLSLSFTYRSTFFALPSQSSSSNAFYQQRTHARSLYMNNCTLFHVIYLFFVFASFKSVHLYICWRNEEVCRRIRSAVRFRILETEKEK